MLKDSGTRDSFVTGAVRDGQQGKGRYDLLPYWPILQVAKVYEAGAKKYAERNWEKGIPLSRFADSAMRHFAKWMNGNRDEDHLHQAIWNQMGLSQTIRWIEEGKLPASLNDLPNNQIVLPRKFVINGTVGWSDIEYVLIINGNKMPMIVYKDGSRRECEVTTQEDVVGFLARGVWKEIT